MFAAIGVGAMVAPKTSSGQYGLLSDDRAALAFVRGMGARDLVIAGLIFSSLGDPAALRRVLGWSSLIGLADGCIVSAVRGPRRGDAVHVAGFAGLVVAALLVRVPPPDR